MIDVYLHMGVALVLVSGLILLLGMFAKKRQEKGCLMKILGYQSLGSKKGMAMVKIGQEVLLLGVTANDVKLLKTIDRIEENVQPQLFEKAVARAAAETAGDGAMATEAEIVFDRPAVRTGRVIMADSGSKLGRLRAIKDSLVCS